MSVSNEELNDLSRYIIENGLVDLSSRDSYGRTALHYASSSGNLPIAKLLLKNGADVNAINNAMETPLLKACGFCEVDMIELLLSTPDINRSVTDYVCIIND